MNNFFLTKNSCRFISFTLGIVLLAALLVANHEASAASASRSLFSGVTTFAASHPRLTKATGLSAAVVGGCLLYRWWKMRNLLPIKSGIAFLVPLPNGNLVVGEFCGSYLSVWDLAKRRLIKKVHIGDVAPGAFEQIVALSDDIIAFRNKTTGAVKLAYLNYAADQVAYQDFDRPRNEDSRGKETILWIGRMRANELICKTKEEHFYQLNTNLSENGNAWVQLPSTMQASMPKGAVEDDSRLQVQLPGVGKGAQVVTGNWLYKGGVVIN
jgi:hypothetical protein